MNEFAGHRLTCIRGERLVFSGLDFRVQAGDALVLVGPNGSGKSSLLRMMADLTRPALGALTWNGVAIAADPEAHHARVRYAGHLDAVKPALSVLENVLFWTTMNAAASEDSSDPARARAEGALDAFGLTALSDVPGRFLSAGQRRRVTLARLVAAPAAIWLLDEPRTALDIDAVGRLDAAVEGHRNGGGLVVLSMHAGDRPAGAAVLDLTHFTAGAAAADDDGEGADLSDDGEGVGLSDIEGS